MDLSFRTICDLFLGHEVRGTCTPAQAECMSLHSFQVSELWQNSWEPQVVCPAQRTQMGKEALIPPKASLSSQMPDVLVEGPLPQSLTIYIL